MSGIVFPRRILQIRSGKRDVISGWECCFLLLLSSVRAVFVGEPAPKDCFCWMARVCSGRFFMPSGSQPGFGAESGGRWHLLPLDDSYAFGVLLQA